MKKLNTIINWITSKFQEIQFDKHYGHKKIKIMATANTEKDMD